MGAGNVAAIFLKYPNLNHRAFRLLTRMALRSLDQPRDGQPAALYFGGEDDLATALGLACPPMPDPSDDSATADAQRKQRRSSLEVVRRCIRELVNAGAIEVASAGHRGRRAEYRLAVGMLPETLTNPMSDMPQANETLEPHPTKRWLQVNETLASSQRNVGVKEEEEKQRNTGRKTHLRNHLTSHAHEENDHTYASASTALRQLPPDHIQTLVERAALEGITSIRAQVVRAAELAQEQGLIA